MPVCLGASICQCICLELYLVVEIVECRFVLCKLLHKTFWKIPDSQLIPATGQKGEKKSYNISLSFSTAE